jgi:two-component system chemotaxis response regulator CheY
MNWLPVGKQGRAEPAQRGDPSLPNPVISKAKPRPAQPSPASGAGNRIVDTPAGPVSQKKILVVDDDAVIRKTACAKLKSNGYQVFTATDASEAVAAVRRHHPDLILLDICFPPDVSVDWDGLKIMTWLRQMSPAKTTPIIIVSGGEPEKYKERCLAAGAAAFFLKPVSYEDLLPLIAKILNQGNDAPAAPETMRPN